MIVETIFSTLDERGKPNFAPMGIIWGEKEITVRPFRNTHTYQNLIATGCGVANVTDRILAFVRSALEDTLLPHFPSSKVPGVVFQEACYWREIKVIEVADGGESARIRCRVLGKGWQRDFLGFNRARNTLIEAAILATRLHLLDPLKVLEELLRYGDTVLKTGDSEERQAYQHLLQYVRGWIDDHNG